MKKAWGTEYINGCLIDDIVKKKVLTKKQCEDYKNLEIPYLGGVNLWRFKFDVEQKVAAAVDAGKLEMHENKPAEIRKASYVRSDGMSDTWCPVNGQTYDSKSQYYKAVKDAGCEIAGDDPSLHKGNKEKVDNTLKEDIANVLYNK